MPSTPKFYVVWQGRAPGIYTKWPDCLRQVHGFPGARYKAFPTRASAEAALKGDPPPFKGKRSGTSSKGGATEERPDETALSVDGACSGNPGPMEYRAVWVGSKEEAFKVGPMLGTNNLGEFLALVDALRLLHERGDSETAIYTDSLTARAWVRNKRANSTLPRNARTAEVWRRIDEATAWLKAHPVRSPIRTWDTRGWGEIPADFGRK